MSQSLKNFIREQSAILGERKLDSPKLSVEVLVCKVLGISRQELLKKLLLDPGFCLGPDSEDKIRGLLARRLRGEPVAYLSGEKEFYGRDFTVNGATLIPRPETEMLVDAAVTFAGESEPRPAGREDAAPRSFRLFADLGAGSGCLAVTLAAELAGWKGLALDISPEALRTARQNALAHRVAERLLFCRADFSETCLGEESLDLIVANPPYISAEEFSSLSPEVKNFEPSSALLSAEEGLALPKAVIALASRALKPGGLLLMEIGCGQGFLIDKSIKSSNLLDGHIVKDLAQLDRMLFAVKKPQTVKKQQV